MSLEDLEIRKYTAPLSAELDRQKEKCAAMKKERDALLADRATQERECLAHQAKVEAERDAALVSLAAARQALRANGTLSEVLSWVEVALSSPAPQVYTALQAWDACVRYGDAEDTSGTHYGDRLRFFECLGAAASPKETT